MNKNIIQLDQSASKTVVITCSVCTFWAAIRFGLDEAHACAVNHEKEYHPGVMHARDRAKKWHARQAKTRR